MTHTPGSGRQNHGSPVRGADLFDTEGFEKHRPPQHNADNLSSVQQAASSADGSSDGTLMPQLPFSACKTVAMVDHAPSAATSPATSSSESDSTPHGDSEGRTRAKPVQNALQPPPKESFNLTSHALALLQRLERHEPPYIPCNVAVWASGTRPPCCRAADAAMPRPTRSLRVGKRSKASCISVESALAPAAEDDHDLAVAAAGAWSADYSPDPTAYSWNKFDSFLRLG